jgi:flagellar FliL protein
MSKTPAKEEAPVVADDAAATAGAKKKKLMLIAIIALLVLGGGGGAAAFFLTKKPANAKEAQKTEKPAPPVFLALENFIVNLQTENGDKYLQTGITLQVRNEEQLNYYKANMPQLRSRILLLLSAKSADDLLTADGKLKLEEELIKQVQEPYNNEEPTPKEAEERRILGVYFTSFMIQ